MQACLDRSPPARSPNLSPLSRPPPPWDPAFGLVSIDRSPASRDIWIADACGTQGERSAEAGRIPISRALFPHAASYHDVYWGFIHHLHRLLGWWMGDLPSYGVVIRIVFDPQHCQSDSGSDFDPAFICEKVHLVNRLQGMGADALRSQWLDATSFDSNALPGRLSTDGTSFESGALSIDVSAPGVKTERLWVASWNECRRLSRSKLAAGTHVARIAWTGGRSSSKANTQDGIRDTAILGPLGQSSIVSRARALAAEMVFGQAFRETGDDGMPLDNDDDDELPEVGPGIFGQGLTISQIVAASAVDTFENGDFDHIPYPLRTIQQRSGSQIHTVYLSSGAISTSPAVEQGEEENTSRLSVRCTKHKPYKNAEYNRSRAFSLSMSDFMPLPPIDFPPPALLPLIRDMDGDSTAPSPPPSSSAAYERFLDQGTDFALDVLRMEPCPPYRPWPHLSQPQPSGLRFFPMKAPPLLPVQAHASRKEQGKETVYEHADVPPHLDPGSAHFDWDVLQGVYGMTFGPWGLEIIYVRSRLLTVHDFRPLDVDLAQDEVIPRPTGPHGPGHSVKLKQGSRSLEETLHWRPEPYVDVGDLHMSAEETSFVRPGCRVIEGVKCSGDANVPRGTISFRAFSRGQHDDHCLTYYSPGPQWANFPPWNGSSALHRSASSGRNASPGRILDCATGRLAIEGFVNAGSWKRCSVKITSADEIQIYWGALRKVAVAKRLTAC